MEDEYVKVRLIHLLKEFHTGQEKSIKGNDLLRELYGDGAAADRTYNNPFNRRMRALMEEINDEGGLICSSASGGYWWAKSLEDGLESAEDKKRRALTQLENARKLEANLKGAFGGQLSLLG